MLKECWLKTKVRSHLEHRSIHSLLEQMAHLEHRLNYSVSRSANSGTPPSAATGPTDRSCPAARQYNIRVHLRRQPSDTDPRKTIGASRALAAARQLINSTDSALHRPPVRRPPQRVHNGHQPTVPHACAPCLRRRCDVFGAAAPVAVKTLRIVMSTANCDGRPLANTSMAVRRWRKLSRSMSRSLACHLTVPPASRHTRECALGSNCACV